MILVVDMNTRADSLAYPEFILPILRCINEYPADERNLSSAPPTPRVKVVHFMDLTPSDLEHARGIIFSGTPLMDNDYFDLIDELSWLKDIDLPMLGICAGMQFLALHYGSQPIPSLEIGMVPIEIVQSSPLLPISPSSHSPPTADPESLSPPPTPPITFEGYNLHRYSIEPSDNLTILARSERSVQAFKHLEKPVFGVMFHPEVRNQEVIHNFLREYC